MKKILISGLLAILFLSCDRPELSVKERRIACESNELRAAKEQDDMELCPAGSGQSCFTQSDLSEIFAYCAAWRQRAESCEKNCKTK